MVGAHRDGTVAQWTQILLPDAALPEAALSEASVLPGYEPIGITRAHQLVLRADAEYGKPTNRLRLVVGGNRETVSIDAPDQAVFADADHGPWVQLSGDRLLALAYSRGTTRVVTYALSGEQVEQSELSPTESPVGVDNGQLVVVDVPPSGGSTATLDRLAAGQRERLAQVPVEALVVLPGGARG